MRRIVEGASELLHRDEKDSVSCPICETQHPRQGLEEVLQQTIGKLSGSKTSALDQLTSQLEQAGNLKRRVQSLKSALTELEQKANTIKTRIDSDDMKELPKKIEECSDREASIQEQIDGGEERLDKMERRLSNLREEDRFHDIRKRLASRKKSKDQFERVERAYNDFVTFGGSVRAIREAVGICLKERLEKDIPQVSDDLSKVFASLTRHSWYDRLTIDRNRLPKQFELQVASSRDPSGRGHPTDVLNGQAESALKLVPYFAFSQADDAPTEVYLVLLDDPTRAFDEEHIETLVERLAELGKHVQLVVASHETMRFRSLLLKNFKPTDYIVVESDQWTHSDGPQLKIKRDESCQT